MLAPAVVFLFASWTTSGPEMFPSALPTHNYFPTALSFRSSPSLPAKLATSSAHHFFIQLTKHAANKSLSRIFNHYSRK